MEFTRNSRGAQACICILAIGFTVFIGFCPCQRVVAECNSTLASHLPCIVWKQDTTACTLPRNLASRIFARTSLPRAWYVDGRAGTCPGESLFKNLMIAFVRSQARNSLCCADRPGVRMSAHTSVLSHVHFDSLTSALAATLCLFRTLTSVTQPAAHRSCWRLQRPWRTCWNKSERS